MATFNVTVPDVLVLGRNGAIGTLPVDWSKVPQHVINHIATTYFPQYITDRANSGGADATQSERMELAHKKLDAMYAGLIRTRGDGTSGDPVDAALRTLAMKLMRDAARQCTDFKTAPGKGDAKCVAAIRAQFKKPKLELDDILTSIINKNPKLRDAAIADVEARAAQKAAQKSAIANIGIEL